MRSRLVGGAARVDTDDVSPAWTAQFRAGPFGYHQVRRRSGRRRRERGQPLIGMVVIATAVLLASCSTSAATRARTPPRPVHVVQPRAGWC
jgi:hypothetical protein